MRQRRAGVWEIRVVVGQDPVTRGSIQRSFTIHGNRAAADEARRDLVDRFGIDRRQLECAAATWTVNDLLDHFVSAEQRWKPSTRCSHTSVVRGLRRDPISGIAVTKVTPSAVTAAIRRWQGSGVGVATVWQRWAVLRFVVCVGSP